MRPRVVIEVAAGLIFRAGQVLITQRPAGTHLAGLWEFPGGKLEPGETWEEALRRELGEELGVEVQVERYLTQIEHDYGERLVRLRFFACRLNVGEPAPLGCAELAWVGPSELGRYAFPPADHELVQKLQATEEFSAETVGKAFDR